MAGYPRQPWPFPVLFAGMLVFGMVATALGVSVTEGTVLSVIAAALGLGRP